MCPSCIQENNHSWDNFLASLSSFYWYVWPRMVLPILSLLSSFHFGLYISLYSCHQFPLRIFRSLSLSSIFLWKFHLKWHWGSTHAIHYSTGICPVLANMILYQSIYSANGNTTVGERVRKNSHNFLCCKLSTLLLTVDLFMDIFGKQIYVLDNSLHRAEETVQWLRTLMALPQDQCLGLQSSTIPAPEDSLPFSGPCCTYMDVAYSYTKVKIKYLFKHKNNHTSKFFTVLGFSHPLKMLGHIPSG